MEPQTGSKLGKGYVKTIYCHLAYLIYMWSILCELPGRMKHKLESRLLGEMSTTSYMQMTDHFMAESEEELKNLLMKVKEESEKVGLKLNIQKMKIMASGPNFMTTRWGKCEKSIRFHFLGLINHCSHEIKRRFLLRRIAMTNLDSVLKNRDITLPTMVCIVKVMIFPVVMYEMRAGQ